jgi:hypothetical protein
MAYQTFVQLEALVAAMIVITIADVIFREEQVMAAALMHKDRQVLSKVIVMHISGDLNMQVHLRLQVHQDLEQAIIAVVV